MRHTNAFKSEIESQLWNIQIVFNVSMNLGAFYKIFPFSITCEFYLLFQGKLLIKLLNKNPSNMDPYGSLLRNFLNYLLLLKILSLWNKFIM